MVCEPWRIHFFVLPSPTEQTDNKWTMSIREITWNWKLERIETARRAIKRSRQTPLGERSEWAIDRSPQIERTVYDTQAVSECDLMFAAQLSLRRTNRSVRRTVSTLSQRRQTLSRRFLAYIASVLCISINTKWFYIISSVDTSVRILTYVTFIFLYPFTVSFMSRYFIFKTFVAYSKSVVTYGQARVNLIRCWEYNRELTRNFKF